MRVSGLLAITLCLLLGGCALGTDHKGADVEHFDVHSAALGRDVRARAVIPDGTSGEGRPLLVFLHGRNGTEDSSDDTEVYEALRAQGDKAPVIVFADGFKTQYWHNRAAGKFGTYVLDDVIPQAQRRYKTNGKVAIGGISMGGFGAYDLGRLRAKRFCAVGGHSPALWQTAGETAPGAFDDAADFARHDVVGAARSAPATLARQPLWLDAGDADPFDPGDKAFVAALRANGVPITVHRYPGAHTGDYWKAHWRDYLPFYANALARCKG